MQVGDLVKYVPQKGCPDENWRGIVIGKAHYLVKVYWFNCDSTGNPSHHNAHEIEVISEC